MKQVSDEGIEAIADNCRSLKELKISSNYGITNQGVSTVLKKCNKLRKLDIGKTYLRDCALQNLRLVKHGSQLKEIRLFKCPNVSFIHMNGVRNYFSYYRMTQ